MKTLDTDSEGHVSIDEFMWWWKLGLNVNALTCTDEGERIKSRHSETEAMMEANQGHMMQLAPTPEEVEEIFNQFDKDKSGCLSLKEVGAAMRRLGYATAGLTTSKALHMFDDSRTGSLSPDEFFRSSSALCTRRWHLHESWRSSGSHGQERELAQERSEMRATDEMPHNAPAAGHTH